MSGVRIYRKKPVEVQAYRFEDLADIEPILWWIKSNGGHAHRNVRRDNQQVVIVIETLEGDMEARRGDVVIRGVQGEFYPCKPDIFDATYAPAGLPEVSTDA